MDCQQCQPCCMLPGAKSRHPTVAVLARIPNLWPMFAFLLFCGRGCVVSLWRWRGWSMSSMLLAIASSHICHDAWLSSFAVTEKRGKSMETHANAPAARSSFTVMHVLRNTCYKLNWNGMVAEILKVDSRSPNRLARSRSYVHGGDVLLFVVQCVIGLV
jgi:hypothetical protein